MFNINDGLIKAISDDNIVNVVYRNNDIVNFLTNVFLNIGDKFGINGDDGGLSSAFLMLYFGTIILYVFIHAIREPKKLYERFLGDFTRGKGTVNGKTIIKTELVQMFFLTIFGAMLLMPAKFQYVVMNQTPASGLPTYIDLDDNEYKEGKVVNTIGIVAITLWVQNRFIFGIKTSSGPVATDTPIDKFSINAIMPDVFNEYFVKMNIAIDGYKYMYNYLNSFKDINEFSDDEFTRYANALDSQFSLFLGQKADFRMLYGDGSNESKKLQDVYRVILQNSNSDNTKIQEFISGSRADEVGNLISKYNKEGLFSSISFLVSKISVVTAASYLLDKVTGSGDGLDLINRQMLMFDSKGHGLDLLNAHVDFLAKTHDENTDYKSLLNEYVENAVTKASSNPGYCSSATCPYFTKVTLARQYLMEDVYSKLVNIMGGSRDSTGNITSMTDISVLNSGSGGIDLSVFAKQYFDTFLAKNQGRLIDEIDKLNIKEYPFKKGIRVLFLLGHTNFLRDIGVNFITTNTGQSFVAGTDTTYPNLVQSLLQHSTFTKESSYKNNGKTYSGKSFEELYKTNSGTNEISEVLNYTPNGKINLKEYLKTSPEEHSTIKLVNNSNSSNAYNQIDNNVFTGYDTSDDIGIDFNTIVNGTNISSEYILGDDRFKTVIANELDYITKVYQKFDPINNFLRPLTEQLLFEYKFLQKGTTYKTILNPTSDVVTEKMIHGENLNLNCLKENPNADSPCISLEAPDISKLTEPKGSNIYMVYNGQNKIELEIEKLTYLKNALETADLPELKKKDKNAELEIKWMKKSLDYKLVTKYLGMLNHYKEKGNTDTLMIETNDELFELFNFAYFIGVYISDFAPSMKPTDFTINSAPMKALYNLYFYPHAIIYFDKGNQVSNKTLDNTSIRHNITNLYNFVKPSTAKEFLDLFDYFEYDSATNKITKSGDITQFDPADDNANISTAVTNYYKNFSLMKQLQSAEITPTPSANINQNTLNDNTIINKVSDITSINQIGNIQIGASAKSMMGDFLSDMLFYVKSNFAEYIARNILLYFIEPYHFIFGKNNLTHLGTVTTLSEKETIKGIFETSNNFHMDDIKMTFQVPRSKVNEWQAFLKKNKETIDAVFDTIGAIALLATPAGAGGMLVSVARTIVKTVVKASVKTIKVAGKATLKTGKYVGKAAKKALKKLRSRKGKSSFAKKSFVGKLTSIGIFLATAPFKLLAMVLGAIFTTVFVLSIVIFMILSIYGFLIKFMYRIAMPLAVGIVWIGLQALTYPATYLVKDMTINKFSGSFKDLNEKYFQGLINTGKTIFKLYILFIIIIMTFVAIYKVAITIVTWVTLFLMFQWQSFDVSVAVITLMAFWFTVWIMSKMLDLTIPESYIGKYNFKNQ